MSKDNVLSLLSYIKFFQTIIPTNKVKVKEINFTPNKSIKDLCNQLQNKVTQEERINRVLYNRGVNTQHLTKKLKTNVHQRDMKYSFAAVVKGQNAPSNSSSEDVRQIPTYMGQQELPYFKPRFTGKCHYCQRGGHIKVHCPNYKNFLHRLRNNIQRRRNIVTIPRDRSTPISPTTPTYRQREKRVRTPQRGPWCLYHNSDTHDAEECRFLRSQTSGEVERAGPSDNG